MVVTHAAERLVSLILSTVSCRCDPRTVDQWCRHLGRSATCIRSMCGLAGEETKDTLDFARVLRALIQAEVNGLAFTDLLDISDVRTLRRLLVRAGYSRRQSSTAADFTVESFFTRQSLIKGRIIVATIRVRLSESQVSRLAAEDRTRIA